MQTTNYLKPKCEHMTSATVQSWGIAWKLRHREHVAVLARNYSTRRVQLRRITNGDWSRCRQSTEYPSRFFEQRRIGGIDKVSPGKWSRAYSCSLWLCRAVAFSYCNVADLLIWRSVKISSDFETIQVLGTVAIEESHNCITFLVTQLQFFSYY